MNAERDPGTPRDPEAPGGPTAPGERATDDGALDEPALDEPATDGLAVPELDHEADAADEADDEPAPTPRRPDGEPAGASRHTRLADELRPPTARADPAAAVEICAAIARERLGDFAPALAFLTEPERRRAQALLAYACTLFDFSRQPGPDGDRLAAINRFEFTLEEAFSGRPAGQPIFERMAKEQARRRWPAEALDALAACARRRATRAQPRNGDEAESAARELARALGALWLGGEPQPEIEQLGGALVRLHLLGHLGDEVGAGRCPLPIDEVGDALARRPEPAVLLVALRRECARLRPPLLGAARGLARIPDGYRRTVAFALFAALKVLARLEEADEGSLASGRPPLLGLRDRIGLLLRARWLRI